MKILWLMFVSAMVFFGGSIVSAEELSVNQTTISCPSAPSIQLDQAALSGVALVAGGEVVALHSQYRFLAVLLGGQSEEVQGECVIYLSGPDKGRIPWMTRVRGEEVLIVCDWTDEPLPGFPYYSAHHIEQFSLFGEGKNNKSETVLFGNCFLESLGAVEPITIDLYPSWKRFFIPYTSPNSSELRIRVRHSAGMVSEGSWDEGLNSFVVWVDPTQTFDYEIFEYQNGERRVVYRGSGRWGEVPQPQANISTVNFSYPNGLKQIDLSEGQHWTDWNTVAEGETKTFFAVLPPGNSLQLFGYFGSELETRGLKILAVMDDQGRTEEVPFVINVYQNVDEKGGSDVTASCTLSGVYGVVIQVTGPIENYSLLFLSTNHNDKG